MNRYLKISAALAAFALLLVVMGLSTQSQTVEAQTVTLASGSNYICSDGCNSVDYEVIVVVDGDDTVTYTPTPAQDLHDNVFAINFDTSGGTVEIYNLNLPRTGTGADKNPKDITLNSQGMATIVAVHKSSGLVDSPGQNIYQVKAFNGNRIQISFTPGGGSFDIIKNVVVDNVKPSLVTNSPSIPLIVSDGVDLTFSADITDGGAGFPSGFDSPGAGLEGALSPDGSITNPTVTTTPAEQNHFTKKGGIRLVVAGNVVKLGSSNFTKIDGGWAVSATINSTAIQGISANVPWYFEVADRANNKRRSTGSISGKAGSGSDATSLVDGKFVGVPNADANAVLNGLNGTTFSGTKIQISRELEDGTVVKSDKVDIGVFDPLTGSFTIPNAENDELWPSIAVDDPETVDNDESETYQCPFDDGDENTNAVTEDCAIKAGDSYVIFTTNLITVDSEEPTLSNPDASGFASSVLTGLGWDSGAEKQKAQKNSIKVTFADKGKRNSNATGSGLDASTVLAAAFTVSGNTVSSVTVIRSVVYLTLADNLGSTEQPQVSIASGVIRDKAGNSFDGARGKAGDNLGPNLTLSRSAGLSNDELTVTITTDEQLNALPDVWVTLAAGDGTAKVPALEDGSLDTSNAMSVTQTGALTYRVAVDADDGDGEYSVYARGEDTAQSTPGTTGNSSSSVSPSSFIFELDNTLNNDMKPIVSVSDNEDVETYKTQKVEQVDPMIVTVDFSQEGKDYSRDSYKTVELTSAKLKITFKDGTSESRTFNLTTEISSPDNVKYTIPILNPKIGKYALTVQATDQAGNNEVQGSEDMKASWEVIAPSPVDIALAPGWNLVSLPFQPANPAINSVINASHPADIVMTFDNASQVWLVSRRDAETGLFVGDIVVMTASTAYFIRTENFQAIRMLRPPLATAAAAPPPPPAITVVKGWNLVPVVSNAVPTPDAIAADAYFGTLRSGSEAGWLKALTFDTLVRTWVSVTPGSTVSLADGGINPCTGEAVDTADVEKGTEPCQIGQYEERSTGTDNVPAVAADDDEGIVAADANGGPDGYVGEFDGHDRVVIGSPVDVGKGYWLYATVDGVIIP